MKAIDTNILVRFLVNDDPVQSAKVYQLFKNAESDKGKLFVTVTVMLETLWVLEALYKYSRKNIIDNFREILLLPVLVYEHHNSIQKFFYHAQDSNYDLADLLHGLTASECGCETVLTFDIKASKSEFFELMK